MKIGQYQLSEVRKAVAAFLFGLATFLAAVLALLTDGSITNQDVITTVVALATWLGGTAAVFNVPNEEV